MKLKEMKIADILQNEVFIDKVDEMRKQLEYEYKTTLRKAEAEGKRLKRNAVVKLIEQGQWETPTIIYLYSQILDKKLQGFSASERNMIAGLCNEAYHTATQIIQDNEKANTDTKRND